MRFAKWVMLVALVILIPPLRTAAQQPPSVDAARARDNSFSKIVDYTLPPDKLQRSHAHYIQSTRLQVIDTIYGFLVLLGLLYASTVAKFRSLAESITQRKWIQGFIVIPLFIIVVAVLTIPSDVYHQHL